MEIRDLERSTINLIPDTVIMQSDTVLVQYIIKMVIEARVLSATDRISSNKIQLLSIILSFFRNTSMFIHFLFIENE